MATLAKTAWLLASVFVTAALGLDLNRQISQYGHTAWRTQDGAFASSPQSIAQTTDGYLWIGTEVGLVRFDGVRFVPWVAPSGKSLPGGSVIFLLASRYGGLWIGTSSGFALWRDGALTTYPPRGRVNAMVEDRDGTIWIAQSRVGKDGSVCRVNGSIVKCFGEADGLTFQGQGAEALAIDQMGGVWIGTVRGVCHWKSGAATLYFPKALEHMDGVSGVLALTLDADGSLMVGVGGRGAGAGLQRLTDQAWSDYTAAGLRGSTLPVSALHKDRDGGLWIGTQSDGIYHVHAGSVDRLTQADGLSGDWVNDFYEDREGNVWAATPNGIDRFRNIAVGTVSKRQGAVDVVSSLFASPSGTVWIGGVTAVRSITNGEVSPLGKERLLGKATTALLEDRAGRLWVGVDSELTVMEHGRFRFVRRPDGSPLGVVYAMTEGAKGNIWGVVTGDPGRLFRIANATVVEDFPLPERKAGPSLAADPNGGVWFATTRGRLAHYQSGKFELVATADAAGSISNLFVDNDLSVWGMAEKGLVRWKEGKLRTLTSRNGLACDNIYSAIKDNSGLLWLCAQCGVMSIAPAELEKWWAQPDAIVKVRLFDVLDGAQTRESPFSPSVSKSPDGRLWFAGGVGLQFIDPDHLPENRLAPLVRIEQVVADRTAYPPQTNLRLPAHTRNLQIDYTALSFVSPQKVRFRYKLDGVDKTWQEPETRRQAFYNDVPPGDHRFRVIASNNDGVWNEAGATLEFSVAPAYYQTVWFQLLAALALAASIWSLYRLRLRQMAARLNQLHSERLAERTRIARDLHDTLLQSLAGVSLQLEGISKQAATAPEKTPSLISHVREQVDFCFREARVKVWNLRSPALEDQGLVGAMREFVERIAPFTTARCEFTVSGKFRPCSPEVEDELLRIAQEASNNAIRHANASKICLNLKYGEDSLTLSISDDGQGFDFDEGYRKSGHWGLKNMQERAAQVHGKCEITTAKGRGTKIEVYVPLSSSALRNIRVKYAHSSSDSR